MAGGGCAIGALRPEGHREEQQAQPVSTFLGLDKCESNGAAQGRQAALGKAPPLGPLSRVPHVLLRKGE